MDQTQSRIRLQSPSKKQRVLMIAAILACLTAALNFLIIKGNVGTELKLLRAKSDVAAGTELKLEMFEVVSLRGDLRQMQRAFLDADDFSAFAGKRLVQPLFAGQLLDFSVFERGLDWQVPQNQEAIALAVNDEAQAVGRLIRPGSIINIYGQINGRSLLLVRNAHVLAVGNETLATQADSKASLDHYSSVTILLNKDKVVDFVSNRRLSEGRLTLSLVNEVDASLPTQVLPVGTPPMPTPTPGQ